MLNMLIVQKTIDMSSRLDDVGTFGGMRHGVGKWFEMHMKMALWSLRLNFPMSHVSLPFCGWEDDGFLFQGKLLEYFAVNLWMFLSTIIKPQERIETKS